MSRPVLSSCTNGTGLVPARTKPCRDLQDGRGRPRPLPTRERTLLERQLQRRFGPLSPAVTDRLHNAPAADLEAWAENVLDARTVGDVFDPNA